VTQVSALTLVFHAHAGDPAALGRLLRIDGAIRTGHYRLLSGQHSDRFLAFSTIAADPASLDLIASWLGPTIDAWSPDAVLSPSTAGVGLAATFARRLSAPLHLAATGADGRPTRLIGTDIPTGTRVLLVNDVTTTGTAIRALAKIAEDQGAVVAGSAWFASRATSAASVTPFPAARAADLDLPSWPAEACRLCKGHGPVAEDAIDLN